jgi:hypothetical protein
MRRRQLTKAVGTAIFGFGMALAFAATPPQTEPKPALREIPRPLQWTQDASEGADAAIACRVLEAKIVQQFSVAVAVFHQARASDGPRLGELLRQHDGAAVEFETSEGHSHPATVLRLGTCFGRGLLVFPAASARLGKNEEFWLRFPEEKGSGK